MFVNPGTYPVTLTATDSRGAATKAETPLVVKSLTGRWADADPRFTFTLTQGGPGFYGTFLEDFGRAAVEGSVAGTMSAPRDVGFYLTYDIGDLLDGLHHTFRCRYEGTLDESGDVFKVHIVFNNSDSQCGRGSTFSVTRQQ
jgi:hypothetical protein